MTFSAIMRLRFFCFTLALGLTGCTQGEPVAPPTAPSTAPSTAPAPANPQTNSKATNAKFADSNDGNLLLGNPTKAAKDPDNFLVERPQYTLSYNRSKGEANWVAWHLDRQDLGGADRGNFRPDPDLPADWQIRPDDYRGSGYDRGHVCPSGDRTASREDNDATFYMSNMLPQTGELNRAVWADSENAIRDIIRQGNEAYIIAGGAGKQKTIAGDKVAVPEICWKVVLILPEGENDLSRINKDTRVLTIAMPNVASDDLKNGDWRKYIVTTKKLADAIKMDFFPQLPKQVQNELESKKDSGF